MSDSPSSIAFLSYFATGPSLDYDSVFQFGCKGYVTSHTEPLIQMWLGSPSKPINETVYRESNVSNAEVAGLEPIPFQKKVINE